MVDIRTGEAGSKLSREQFSQRFLATFADPDFQPEAEALARIEQIAWHNYQEGRKAPVTQKAGDQFADPDYDLSVEWLATREKLLAAELTNKDTTLPTRVLVITGSSRNDGSCPGEISKSYRMQKLCKEVIEGDVANDAVGNIAEEGKAVIDYLDLSLVTSTYNLHIHPCKGCASTAMPLCHWPCSCYPNHSLNQVGDWMAEIYERWTLAHAVIIITPVYWYQSPGPLKQMIDRLVCADGGNADPTSTHGKSAEKAKQLELAGWSYPKHLAGRTYGLVVHGDVAGIEGVRRSLSDWLDWMGLKSAGPTARLDRFIGYYQSYAESHKVMDADSALQEEVRNVARAVLKATRLQRQGNLPSGDDGLQRPRPK